MKLDENSQSGPTSSVIDTNVMVVAIAAILEALGSKPKC